MRAALPRSEGVRTVSFREFVQFSFSMVSFRGAQRRERGWRSVDALAGRRCSPLKEAFLP